MDIIDPKDERRQPFRRRASDKIEQEVFDRLARLEEDHLIMSKSVTKMEIIVENSVNLIERFENTLDRMASTLAQLNITIATINERVNENSKDIAEVESGVTQVKDKLKIVDDKGKIDFLSLIKDNFAKAIFGGGILGALIFWIDHLIDQYVSLKK